MFFSPNAPGTTAQPTFFHHSFLTFHTFQFSPFYNCTNCHHLHINIQYALHFTTAQITFFNCTFQFYNCTNCDQLHVKICPANDNTTKHALKPFQPHMPEIGCWPCLLQTAVSDLMTRRSGLRRPCASGSSSANLMDAHAGPRSPQTVTTGYPAPLDEITENNSSLGPVKAETILEVAGG